MDERAVPYAWWRAVLDALDEPVVVVGHPYHIVDTNEAVGAALGVGRGALLGAAMPAAGGASPARDALDGKVFDTEVSTERVGPFGVRSIRQRTVAAPDGAMALAVMLDHTDVQAVRASTEQHRAEISILGEQLHRLASQLVEARDDERAAIARGLHDDTLQRLAALRWELDDERLAGRLEACYEAVRDVIRQVRADPTAGAQLGAALDELAGRSPVACSMSHTLHGDIANDVADVVWRAVREAIRSAVLRQAGHVSVRVTDSPHGLAVEVRDDGRWAAGDGAGAVRKIVRPAGGRVVFRRRDSGALVSITIPAARGPATRDRAVPDETTPDRTTQDGAVHDGTVCDGAAP